MAVTARATSTTLDVVLFVVLVAAAVTAVLAAPSPPRDVPESDGAVSTVTGVTLGVDVSEDRRSADTLANLLADAAVVTASGERPPVVGRVRTAANRTLRNVSGRVQVVAVYRPFDRLAPISRVRAGPAPPADAAVDAVSVTVPLERLVAPATLDSAAEDGHGPLARRAARSLVGRIRRACRTLDCRAPSRETLSTRLSSALAAAYETPAAAADGYRGARVTLVVRRWSA